MKFSFVLFCFVFYRFLINSFKLCRSKHLLLFLLLLTAQQHVQNNNSNIAFYYVYTIPYFIMYTLYLTVFLAAVLVTKSCLILLQHHGLQPVCSPSWKILWRMAWQTTPVFLPGEFPWTEESGGPQSIGSQRIGHD